MLEKLLNEIRAGGTLETGTLATRLGTTPQLIEAMLGHLQRSGLIQAYVDCGDGCQGCSLQDACNKPDQSTIRLWQSKPDRQFQSQ
jgi:FeoC like transcriptional regulator